MQLTKLFLFLRKMKTKYLIFILTIILSGCELIEIGTKKPKLVDISQHSALGAIMLFKTELDSQNVFGASRLFASPDGSFFIAEEKFALYDDIARLGRIIGTKPITAVIADSNITLNPQIISVKIDYLKKISFTTCKINDTWYIIAYSEQYNTDFQQ